MNRFPKALVALLIVLGVVLVLAAAAFFFRPDLVRLAKEQIDQFLSREGIHLDYTLSTGGRIDGVVVLRDLVVYETARKETAIARLNHLYVRVPLRALFRDRALTTHLFTRNAEFTALAREENEEDATLEDLDARMDCLPGQLAVRSIRGRLRGVTLRASGDVRLPSPTAGPKDPLGEFPANPDPREEPDPAPPSAPSGSSPPGPPPAQPAGPRGPAPVPSGIEEEPSPAPAPNAEPPVPVPTTTPAPAAATAEGGEPEPDGPSSSANPTHLDFSPLLQLASLLDYREADWEPRITATFSGAVSDGTGESNWDVGVETRDFPSRAVQLTVSGTLLATPDGDLIISEARIIHESGEAVLAGSLRDAEDEVRIERFESHLDWIGVLRDHPAVEEPWDSCTVVEPPRLTATGSWHLETPEATDLTFSLSQLSLEYQQAEGKPLPMEQIATEGTLREGLLHLRDGTAVLAKGIGEGDLTYTPFAEEPMWTADIEANQMFLGAFASPEDGTAMSGFIDLRFQGEGGSEPSDLQGSGELSITQGDFFHARVVGPLLRFLNRISRNPDKGNPDELEASFVIQDGIISTSDLVLEISEASITAAGTIDMNTEEARFEAEARLRGPLGVSVHLLGDGPLDNVAWRMAKYRDVEDFREAMAAEGKPLPEVENPPDNGNP